MGKITTDKNTGNTGLIRYVNAGSVLQITLANELADAFSKHLPTWHAKRNPLFSFFILMQRGMQGILQSKMSDGF